MHQKPLGQVQPRRARTWFGGSNLLILSHGRNRVPRHASAEQVLESPIVSRPTSEHDLTIWYQIKGFGSKKWQNMIQGQSRYLSHAFVLCFSKKKRYLSHLL
jgi:hypothetical protein